MPDQLPSKMVVSVTEMAQMVGLSRQRFHQLRGTAFPEPKRDSETGRPYYDEGLQQICLSVRKRNRGVDNRPVLFYSRRSKAGCNRKRSTTQAKPKSDQLSQIAEAVKALGLPVLDSQVEKAVATLFPSGTEDADEGEIVRAVFLHLQRGQ